MNKTVCTDLMISPSSSKLFGAKAPASFRALFLATAVSDSWLAQAPAWPNWTWGGGESSNSHMLLIFKKNEGVNPLNISLCNSLKVPEMHLPLHLPSHLWGEHGGTGTNTPAHHWLCDPALFNSLADLVLLRASDLWKAETDTGCSK